MSTAEWAVLVLLGAWAVTTLLLMVAVGGNSDLAATNRRLRRELQELAGVKGGAR